MTRKYSSDYDKIKSTHQLEENLIAHLSTINWIDCNIILLGENKNIFTSTNTQPRLSATSIAQSYWYQKGLLGDNLINWFVFEKSYFTQNTNDAMIVATKTLVNNATNKNYGIIIIEINEEFFIISIKTL